MNKILIIEDNEEIRENTAELLSLHDFDVFTAQNGADGFLMAQSHRPDLILCDIMMPETDGSMFLHLARNDEDVRQIPLVFFSAGTSPLEMQKTLIKAANGFLKKPFTEEELIRTVNKFLHPAA